MKIYLVCDDSVDNFDIIKCFIKRENAEEFMDDHNNDDNSQEYYSIYEYETED